MSDVLVSSSGAGHLIALRHCFSLKLGVRYFCLGWLSRKLLGSVCLSPHPTARVTGKYSHDQVLRGCWDLNSCPHAGTASILIHWAIFSLLVIAKSEDYDFMIPSKLFSFSCPVLGVPSCGSEEIWRGSIVCSLQGTHFWPSCCSGCFQRILRYHLFPSQSQCWAGSTGIGLLYWDQLKQICSISSRMEALCDNWWFS